MNFVEFAMTNGKFSCTGEERGFFKSKIWSSIFFKVTQFSRKITIFCTNSDHLNKFIEHFFFFLIFRWQCFNRKMGFFVISNNISLYNMVTIPKNLQKRFKCKISLEFDVNLNIAAYLALRPLSITMEKYVVLIETWTNAHKCYK